MQRALVRRMGQPERFDADYYFRHYQGRNRCHTAADVGQLASGVCGLAGWYGIPLTQVLDVGAGPGLWRDWFRANRPDSKYRSTDFSPHACQAYGHEQRDISRWRACERFDLVICQSVLQYLDDAAADRAIANIGAMCRGLLYLEVVTRRDLRTVIDMARSDTDFEPRTAAWYRARLGKWFVHLGAGLWASHRAGLAFYELEASR